MVNGEFISTRTDFDTRPSGRAGTGADSVMRWRDERVGVDGDGLLLTSTHQTIHRTQVTATRSRGVARDCALRPAMAATCHVSGGQHTHEGGTHSIMIIRVRMSLAACQLVGAIKRP